MLRKQCCSCLLFISAFVAIFFATASFCQAPEAIAATDSGTMHLDVVVTTKAGEPVAELRQQDFTMLDNKAPRVITSFRAQGGEKDPTEAILLVDAVNTSYESIAYERGQIDKFLRADSGHLALPTALAIMKDTDTEIQKGFTRDGNALAQDLDGNAIGLREIRRSTGIYGADERLQISLTALRRIAAQEAGRPGRKMLLWVSPGWPLLTGPNILLDNKQQESLFATVVDVSTQLRRAGITLYSIDSLGVNESIGRSTYYEQFTKGVSKPSQVVIGNLGLQVLAVQTGGLALNSSDVAQSLRQCVGDTKAYYELTFDPAKAARRDEYHHLEIGLDKAGLTARTRQGYYAQP